MFGFVVMMAVVTVRSADDDLKAEIMYGNFKQVQF